MFEEKCRIHNQVYDNGKGSYTISEICQILGICKGSARKLTKTNQFNCVRLGREIRIVKSSFDAWLDRKNGRLNYGINCKEKE